MALQDELVPKPCEKTAKRPVCNPRKTTFFERFCCLQRLLAFDKIITFRQENTKRKHHGSEGRKSIKMFPAAAAATAAAAPAPLIPSVQKADGPAPWQ